MYLDTTETAGIPGPLSSPAEGQKCASVCFRGCTSVCVCVSMCDSVNGFNKLPGPRSTICLGTVWWSRSWLWGTPLSGALWDERLTEAPVYCHPLPQSPVEQLLEVYNGRRLCPLQCKTGGSLLLVHFLLYTHMLQVRFDQINGLKIIQCGTVNLFFLLE